VRLRVNDFAAAIQGLRAAGCISAAREDGRVCPAPGVETDRLTRWLVEHGFRVFEIASETQSLEAFYLSLMNDSDPA
jgi:hypothetical protein